MAGQWLPGQVGNDQVLLLGGGQEVLLPPSSSISEDVSLSEDQIRARVCPSAVRQEGERDTLVPAKQQRCQQVTSFVFFASLKVLRADAKLLPSCFCLHTGVLIAFLICRRYVIKLLHKAFYVIALVP